jgi:hypothetical protein
MPHRACANLPGTPEFGAKSSSLQCFCRLEQDFPVGISSLEALESH